MALGASGCLIGRAYLYGLAAMGEAGVAKALSLIADELRMSMSLTGVRDIAEVSRDILFDNDDDRAGISDDNLDEADARPKKSRTARAAEQDAPPGEQREAVALHVAQERLHHDPAEDERER